MASADRLPPPGTRLEKRDREGNLKCWAIVGASGSVVFDGVTYPSISASARAAASRIGLASTSQDGYAFWGLKKRPPEAPSQAPAGGDALPGQASLPLPTVPYQPAPAGPNGGVPRFDDGAVVVPPDPPPGAVLDVRWEDLPPAPTNGCVAPAIRPAVPRPQVPVEPGALVVAGGALPVARVDEVRGGVALLRPVDSLVALPPPPPGDERSESLRRELIASREELARLHSQVACEFQQAVHSARDDLARAQETLRQTLMERDLEREGREQVARRAAAAEADLDDAKRRIAALEATGAAGALRPLEEALAEARLTENALRSNLVDAMEGRSRDAMAAIEREAALRAERDAALEREAALRAERGPVEERASAFQGGYDAVLAAVEAIVGPLDRGLAPATAIVAAVGQLARERAWALGTLEQCTRAAVDRVPLAALRRAAEQALDVDVPEGATDEQTRSILYAAIIRIDGARADARDDLARVRDALSDRLEAPALGNCANDELAAAAEAAIEAAIEAAQKEARNEVREAEVEPIERELEYLLDRIGLTRHEWDIQKEKVL